MSSTLRIGLVGCGRVAERYYLPALARAEAARLVAIADPMPADVFAALSVAAAERSAAQKDLLAAHYRGLAPGLAPLRARARQIRAGRGVTRPSSICAAPMRWRSSSPTFRKRWKTVSR